LIFLILFLQVLSMGAIVQHVTNNINSTYILTFPNNSQNDKIKIWYLENKEYEKDNTLVSVAVLFKVGSDLRLVLQTENDFSLNISE
jgi:hypothetical protein